MPLTLRKNPAETSCLSDFAALFQSRWRQILSEMSTKTQTRYHLRNSETSKRRLLETLTAETEEEAAEGCARDSERIRRTKETEEQHAYSLGQAVVWRRNLRANETE